MPPSECRCGEPSTHGHRCWATVEADRTPVRDRVLVMSHLVENLPKMQAGARVRAPSPIHYIDDDITVDEGSVGEIMGSSHGGALAFVMWDGCPGIFETSADSLEVVS